MIYFLNEGVKIIKDDDLGSVYEIKQILYLKMSPACVGVTVDLIMVVDVLGVLPKAHLII